VAIEQSLAELLIILRNFAHVMSLCDLNLWPLDLELLLHFACHAFKLCTKFERNRIIHGWDIDDLAPFRRAMSEYRFKIGDIAPTGGAGWPIISGRRSRPHQLFSFSEN